MAGNGKLSSLDFELAYLALLTKRKVKRMSRWEGALPPEAAETLMGLGLEIATVTRKTLLGRSVPETVFSSDRRWVQAYLARFDRTRIRKTPGEVRALGWLLGYPGCCVDAFVKEPYTRNDLEPCDQDILFHWACRGCKVTPGLLGYYRDVYRECLSVFGRKAALVKKPYRARRKVTPQVLEALLGRKAAPIAAGLAALLLVAYGGCGTSDNCCGPDLDQLHMSAVADDSDGDYLSFAEEILCGTCTMGYDTDADGVVDGIRVARAVKELIRNLPPECEIECSFTMCTENCEACGQPINMGGVAITNTLRGESIHLPWICLHYLEHGSLTYTGTTHRGRLPLERFRRIMPNYDEAHAVTEGFSQTEDSDHDGLLDNEESQFGTEPAVADTDGDSVKDGPQATEDLLKAIANLPRQSMRNRPYMIEHPARGIETCEVCGAIFNMGYVNIVNPGTRTEIRVPYVALHYLAHGSFSYRGTTNNGRVSPVQLRQVLASE